MMFKLLLLVLFVVGVVVFDVVAVTIFVVAVVVLRCTKARQQ